MKMTFVSKNALISAVALVLILIGAASSYYFYNQYQKAQKQLQNPTGIAKEEVKDLVSRVGKLIELPKTEEPTVATVTDVQKIKDQPFFQKAKNGDKVLVYTKTKKAILYRPSTNKIIDVAPVNIGNSTATTSATTQAKLRVALYNGTTTVGLTNVVEKQLKEKIPTIEVVDKENASKNDYAKTIVIDISGNRKDIAEQVAKVLNGTTEKLPEGETKPANADILVILGK